jgi:hypothetical protein
MSERNVEKLSRQKATGKHRINFNSARHPAQPADPRTALLIYVKSESVVLLQRKLLGTEKYTLYE